MPIVILTFSINVAMGMINRAVPQISVFFESFPVKIMAGMALTMFIMGLLIQLYGNIFMDMEMYFFEALRLL